MFIRNEYAWISVSELFYNAQYTRVDLTIRIKMSDRLPLTFLGREPPSYCRMTLLGDHKYATIVLYAPTCGPPERLGECAAYRTDGGGQATKQ